MEVFKFFGSIGLKAQEAEQGLKKIRDGAESTASKMTDTFKNAAKVIGGVFAVGKIIDFSKVATEAAASAEELNGAFAQVFSGFETQAQEAMAGVSDTIKSSEGRFKEAFLNMTAFAKTSGMETQDAIDLSARAIEAAADYTAMYGGTLEGTTASLQSFLKGNYENDAALGISATETTRNAKANELYGQSFKELSEAQKQLTLLAMVEEGNELSGALGQAAREANSFANVTGELKNAWNEFLIIVGGPILKAVIPVIQAITKGVQWLAEAVVPVAETMGEWFSEISKATKGPLKNIGKWFTTTGKNISKYFNSAFNELSELFSLIDWDGILNNFSNVVDGVLDFFEPLADGIKQHLDIIIDYFSGLWQSLKLALNGDWNGAFNKLKNTFTTSLTSIGDNLLIVWSSVWNNIKDLMTNIDWSATGQTIMSFLASAITNSISFLGDIGASIRSWIQEKLNLDEGSTWSDIGKTILGLITTGITSAISGVSNIGSQIITWIFNSLSSTGNTDWLAVGESILLGIFNTISSLTSSFTQIVVAIIKGINDMMTAEQFHNLVNTMLDMIVVAILAIAGGLGAVATALVNGIALGLLGADNWGDVVANISSKINEVLTANPFEFDWMAWLNLDPRKWDWSNTGFVKMYEMIKEAFDEPLPNTVNPNGDGSGSGTFSTGMSSVLVNQQPSQLIELGDTPDKPITFVDQYDTMATEATTGMNKVNQAIRAGYEAIRTTFNQMESNMVRLMTQIMTKLTEPVGPGMARVNQSFRKGYEAIRTTFTQMSSNLKTLSNTIVNGIVTEFNAGASRVRQAGISVGQGFYNGLNSQRSRIISLASQIANSVDNTIRRALDINSPSRVAMETMRFYGDGLVNGLINSIKKVKEASTEVTDAIVGAQQFEEPEYTFDIVKNMKYSDLYFDDSAKRNEKETEQTLLKNSLMVMEEMARTMKALLDKNSNLFLDGHVLGSQGAKYINKQNYIEAARNARLGRG